MEGEIGGNYVSRALTRSEGESAEELRAVRMETARSSGRISNRSELFGAGESQPPNFCRFVPRSPSSSGANLGSDFERGSARFGVIVREGESRVNVNQRAAEFIYGGSRGIG